MAHEATTADLDSTTSVDTITIASVGFPVPPVATHKQDMGAAMVIGIGLLSGYLGSTVTQLLSKLVKSKMKKEVKKEEPPKERESSVECRTHHMKCIVYQQHVNAKLAAFEARVSSVEAKENDFDFDIPKNHDLEELVKRIEKLEKKRAPAKKKK